MFSFIARNTEILNGKGNVETDKTKWLNFTTTPTFDCSQESVMSLEIEILNEFESEDLEEFRNDLNKTNLEDIGTLQEDALEYISGYIIRKLNLTEYQCSQNSCTWVDQISKGFLKKPTVEFLHKIKELDLIFNDVNEKEISHKPNLHKDLVEKSLHIDLPEKIKEFFFKCRIHFRVRHLNKNMKIKKDKLRLMANSKMHKISL